MHPFFCLGTKHKYFYIGEFMPDPRTCLKNFSTTGTNLGGRTPSFRTRDVRRDYENVQQTLENIGDRVEGGVNAAKNGDFLGGQFSSGLNELRCPPTPYASFFAALQPPKFPFMFATRFFMNPDFEDLFGGDQTFPYGHPQWFVKQSSRPNINYEYEEVNMYNFRTRILKRSEFQPVSMTMYDDLKDATGSWWNTYIRLMSPITNISEFGQLQLEELGMKWNTDDINDAVGKQLRLKESDVTGTGNNAGITPLGYDYSSGTGVLPTKPGTLDAGNVNILSAIQIIHILEFGKKMVLYTYRNPKFTEIRFNDLDWEQNGPSTVETTFQYDSFEISYKGAFSDKSVQSLNMPPAYPIKPDGPTVNLGPFSF
jgi:hypothetical protein